MINTFLSLTSLSLPNVSGWIRCVRGFVNAKTLQPYHLKVKTLKDKIIQYTVELIICKKNSFL